jgi:hypothetical protein
MNDTKELMPLKFELKSDKIFSMLRFEPESLGRTTDPLANSTTPPITKSYSFTSSRKKNT